jgi:glucosamine-6-phosphate deaminase
MRKKSSIAPTWWDYTTLELDPKVTDKIANMGPEDLINLSRPGFKVVFYDTIEEFYLAEALEYVNVWQQATEDNPVGLCGPIGPTEQLPLVARIINELNISVKHAHFWSMDEWVVNGKEIDAGHSLSFQKAFRDLCYSRIDKKLVMPEENIHFPKFDTAEYVESWKKAKCLIMQGGQGDVKHWAFNEPPKREGKYQDAPQTVEEYKKLPTRVLDLHPITIQQNSRLHCGGNVPMIPTQAITVGPLETWQTEKVSIWHAGAHDNPFGQRLTTYMISNKIPDTSVPMSVLADHPNVQFNYLREGLGTCSVEMH